MSRLSLQLGVLYLLSAVLLSCSSAQLTPPGELACRRAQSSLKRRIGPELGKVTSLLAIPLSSTSFGCALIFTRIDEELPGEVSGVYGQSSSEELAVALPSSQGEDIITLIPQPSYREESVRLTLSLKELHSGAPPELIVSERATRSLSRYEALQVYAFAEGVPSPREILSESLRFKTTDGITVTASWSVERFEEKDVILIRGGGEYRVYQWHDSLQSFKLDLAASTRYKQGQSRRP